jgi:predicted RNase H-like HicB family nuclease
MIEMDEDNFYIVSCPVFKGCHSYGKSIDEAMNNIREVIEMCMEEEPQQSLNRFIGFREMQMTYKRKAS